MSAPYSRDALDAKFAGLRHEFRADLNALEGRITGKLEALEGRVSTKFAELEGRVNAGFEALRGEFRKDNDQLRGEFRQDNDQLRQEFGQLRLEFVGMKGEFKVWFLILGTLVAVLSTGIGSRVLDRVWPGGQAPAVHTGP